MGGAKTKTKLNKQQILGFWAAWAGWTLVFAKLKHLLRKAAARTREAVCAAIAELLGAFTPDECANYLKNSGYDRA